MLTILSSICRAHYIWYFTTKVNETPAYSSHKYLKLDDSSKANGRFWKTHIHWWICWDFLLLSAQGKMWNKTSEDPFLEMVNVKRESVKLPPQYTDFTSQFDQRQRLKLNVCFFSYYQAVWKSTVTAVWRRIIRLSQLIQWEIAFNTFAV